MTSGLWRAWWRLFAVQASWNHERLQGIGAAHAIEPLLHNLPGGVQGPRYRDAMRRATSFFNSHPYLTGLAVGAIARAEHDAVPPEQIERLKNALPAPLGALGDQLIWAGVLPAASGLGLALSITAGWWVGPIVFLGLYNAVHLFVRTWALVAGWWSGLNVAQALGQPWLRGAHRVVGPMAAVSVGFALPITGFWLVVGMPPVGRAGTIGVAAVGVVLSRWFLPTLSGLRFGLAAVTLALVVGWLWR